MFVWTLALVLLFGSSCLAQQDPVPTAENSLLQNMSFHVSLTRDLSSSKAKVGDSIQLNYFGEVKDRSDKVLLNSKARFHGRVTEVAKHTKHSPEARLAILVDHAEF